MNRLLVPAILGTVLALTSIGCAASDATEAETSESAITSGAVDKTYGTLGTAKLPEAAFKSLPGFSADVSYAKELRDGRLMLLASLIGGAEVPKRGRAVVLTKQGTIDNTFGNQGVFERDDKTRFSTASELSNGDIILYGYDDQGTAILRLRPDGTVDPSFGVNGELTGAELGPASRYFTIDPGDEGGIYVEQLPKDGFGDNRLTIDRFDLHGQRDPASITRPYFTGEQTQAVTSPPGPLGRPYRHWSGQVVAADGNIYVGQHVFASETNTYVRVRKLTKSGVDTSWASAGELRIPNAFDSFHLLPLADGRLVVKLENGKAYGAGSDLVTVDSTGKVVGAKVPGDSWLIGYMPTTMPMHVDREAGAFYVFTDGRGKNTLSRLTVNGPDATFPALTFVRDASNGFQAPTRVVVGPSGFYTFGNLWEGELRLTKYLK